MVKNLSSKTNAQNFAKQKNTVDNDHRSTDRLEFFSDAVIAIAATLLAIELKVPHTQTEGGMTLLQILAGQWPSYGAFVISFLFIGIAWAAHHDMFHYIQRTNHILLVLNLFFLMGIALQPFSTSLLVEHFGKLEERTAALVYHGILLWTSIGFNVTWQYATHHNLTGITNPRLLRTLKMEYAVAPILHTVSFLVALWSVPFSFVPLLALYTFFILPRADECST